MANHSRAGQIDALTSFIISIHPFCFAPLLLHLPTFLPSVVPFSSHMAPSSSDTTSLTHGGGTIHVGDVMSRQGLLDHLHHIRTHFIRPHKFLKSEARRVVAVCTSPACSFRIHANAFEGDFKITRLSPHTCTPSDIVPRKRRTKISHLPLEIKKTIMEPVKAKSGGKGGTSSAKAIKASCMQRSGVDISASQVVRMRRTSSSSGALATFRKLQLLPEGLQHILDLLPDARALLKMSALGSQLEAAARDAFNSCDAHIDISEEKSVESLYFAESDLVRHVELNIGHRVYVADAAHMHRETVGYDCIVMLMTRRTGDGRIFVPAWCLTVREESEETWTCFFRFCLKLGMEINHPEAVVVSDMDKGISSACTDLGINRRECLQHIFARMQNEHHMFRKGKAFSRGAFFAFAKASREDYSNYRLGKLQEHHLKPEKINDFISYWESHEELCSAQSALTNGFNVLDTFTSNNAETKNSNDSINTTAFAARSLPWIDYLTTSLSKARTFFATGLQNISAEMRTSGRDGITIYAAGRISAATNSGRKIFQVSNIYPEPYERPRNLNGLKERQISSAFQSALQRYTKLSLPDCFSHTYSLSLSRSSVRNLVRPLAFSLWTDKPFFFSHLRPSGLFLSLALFILYVS